MSLSQYDKKLKTVPEALKKLDDQLTLAKEQFDNHKKTKDDIEKKQRTYEREIKENVDRIRKLHDKSRDIKTNKEYQTILKSIDDVKAKNSLLEEEVIKCLYDLESLNDNVKQLEKEFLQQKEDAQKKRESIENNERLLKEEYQQIIAEKNELTEKINPKLMKRYHSLKSITTPPYIATIVNETCTGCNMSIPPQFCIEVQRGDELYHCPLCERIIFCQSQSS